MPQEIQATVGNKLRDLRIKSVFITPAENVMDTVIKLDVDHRIANGDETLDQWQNYQGPDFTAAEIGKAIGRVIASGVNMTKGAAAQLISRLPAALAVERINPTQE